MSNSDVFAGKWKQIKGRVKETWGDLTDDEVDQMEGKKDRLIGKLQEKYGYTKEEAEKHIDGFMSKVS